MKKLVKGSRLDELPPDMPEGSWGLAKNIVNYKKFGGISNENGADNITPVAIPTTIYENFPDKPVIGVIPINRGSVFFFSPSVRLHDSEIGIVDDQNRYHPIFRDVAQREVLFFNIAAPIQGTFERKFNDNLIIAWRDSINNPRILNTDCLPFTIDANYNVVIGDLSKARALIKLFPDVLTPEVSDLALSDNGGALKTGTYYPIVSYELKDKSTTSWLRVYNPFPVVQDSSSIAFNQYDGDFSNLATSKKLHIEFSDVDTNYLNLRFGVIILQAGQYTAYFISSFRINGTTLGFDYTGTESTIISITLDEVLIPNAVYNKAGTITNLLGKLYLGNVEKQQQISYQPYANMINVGWVRGDDITLMDTQGESYKDEKVIFFDKSFRSNEVMALYIAFKYKNGTYSDGFHIPGRALIAGDDAVVSDTEIDKIDPHVLKFQILETAKNDGTMGYWKNETEFYPDIDDFNSIPVGGVDLRNQPVRHHKFPEISTIVTGDPFSNPQYFKRINKTGHSMVLNTPTLVAGLFQFVMASNTTSFTFLGLGTFAGNEIKATAVNTAMQMSGTIDYQLTGLTAGGAEARLVLRDNTGQVIYTATSGNITVGMTTGGAYSGSFTVDWYWFLPTIGNVVYASLEESTSTGVMQFVGSSLLVEDGTAQSVSKPLGIRVSNVNIPSAIAPLIDSWEIFYAKRDSSSIRMIGQDIPKESRFHSFDLVYNQANLKGDYLRRQLYVSAWYGGTTNNHLADNVIEVPRDETLENTVDHIDTFYYVGENTLAPINNTGKSTSIYIDPIPSGGQPQADISLYDICIYRKDVYKSFDSQALVSTGKAFKVLGAGVQTTRDIYGGDTFISAFGFIEDISAKNQYLIPHESAANIGLRMDDETIVPSKYYYPKHVSTDPNPPTISYYGYNNDFTALNTLNKVFPRVINFDNCTSDIYVFPYLIAFSLTDANENLKLNWRIFKVNSYYDQLPKDKGRIWNLLGTNRTLYIQQEYALLIAEVKDSLAGGGTVTIALGVSDIFDRPPVEVLPTNEGYVGSQSQFGTIMCPMGYVTVDRQQGKVFVYQPGQELQEISNQGYYHFFRERGQTVLKDIDNPYIGNGYTVAYDLENKRLMIVKKDSNPFTLSYCSDSKQWMCFHDYHPNYMFSTRDGLYAGINVNRKLYKHNSKTLKSIFYDGVMYNSYIDVPFNQGQETTKVFANFNWITHVRRLDGVMMEEETLTNLMVYNNNQCSGDINLQIDNGLWFGRDAKNTEETWNFNKFRDLIKDKNNPFIDANGDLITSNININKAWFEKSKFISKFVIVRFTYNNVGQRDLHIVSVDANIRQSNR